MVMSAYIPTAADLRGPYGQYREELRSDAPGLMGQVGLYSSPYMALERAGMGGFAPRFSQYLLGEDMTKNNPTRWDEWLSANHTVPTGDTAGGGFGYPLEKTSSRWADIVGASRAMQRHWAPPAEGATPWTSAYATPGDFILSPFATYLGAMGEEGYTGARSLEQEALARAAIGGPTRGFLGGLANQRAQRYRNMFERMQLSDPGTYPEEAYLGWLSGRLPRYAPGYLAPASVAGEQTELADYTGTAAQQ